jgi:peptide/nickel transport system substrate-binding protein
MLILVVPILAACGGTASTAVPATSAPAAATPTTAASGANATAAPADSPTAQPTTPPTEAAATDTPPATTSGADKTIIVGMTQFPDTLFGIESQSSATTQVLQAVQPVCMNTLSYEYQSVCFEKVPNLADGDAITTTVTVDNTYAGNIVDSEGNLITDTSTLAAPLTLPQMQVTWTLIDGLTWEDGEPVKASDFVFAANLYNDPGVQNTTRFILDRTQKFETVDEKSFTWYSAPGYTDATYFTNYFGPEPEHVLGSMNPADIGSSEYANHPLAYGPYKVVENIPQESTTLVANETYWKASEGLPKVGTIVFKYLTSEDQILQQLEGGEIDVVGQIGLTLANAPKLDEMEAAGSVKAQYIPATTWEHLDFGVERGDGQASFFDDVRVRQAVAYAVNRQEIIDEVLFGKTVVMNSFMPQDHWAYPPNGEGLETYDFNPEKAGQLLDEAGWTLGADGIREKDGRKFAVQFYTTENNATRQSVAQILQSNLRDVGIDATLNFVPGTAVLFKNGKDGILSGRTFDLSMSAWTSGPEPSTALYLCDQVPTPENNYAGQNNEGWCNAEYDQAALASQAATERADRIPFVIEAQKIFNAELPTLPLYQRINIGAHNPRMTGLDINPTSQVDFWNIETWDITN